MTMLQIGIVVPTLGTRPEFLEQCLRSIRQSGDCWIALVVPKEIDVSRFEEMGLCNQRVDDPQKGLAMAINAGIASLPSGIEFVNWLGDDDLLEPASLNYMARLLHDKQADFAWGKCRYISGDGQTIGMNRSGTWAKWLIRVGPNLIPQPGSLFTRRAFNAEGCLTDNYGWAFDQELFTKFVRSYRTLYVPKTVASFRWHSGSLSAGARNGSVRESSQIRIANMPAIVRPISRLWEPMMCWVISLAGLVVTIRANKTKS